MGCDIHMMIERKFKTKRHGEVWATVNPLNAIYPNGLAIPRSLRVDDPPFGYYYRVEHRNYEFFADLACVRGEGEYQERGLPDDIAPMTLEYVESWDLDGHSHSYLYADEFIPLYIKHCFTDAEKTEYAVDRLEGSSDIQIFHLIMGKHFNVGTKDEDDPRDYRFVFFFDN